MCDTAVSGSVRELQVATRTAARAAACTPTDHICQVSRPTTSPCSASDRQRPGGGLVLVHLDDILARLSPESVRTLRGVFQFDRRVAHAADPTVARPVLTDERISYLREYINLGHAHPGVPPLLPSQRSALDELDALLDGSAPRRSWKLAPGELAVIDNRTLCHGRTPFRDDADGTQRLMLRTWIRATGGRRR